jgi:hypothetical protein
MGSPDILAIKDPLLTPHFHHLAEMLPEARFLVATRDPRDAVLSRLDVARRLAGAPPTSEDIEEACSQYNFCYEGILSHLSSFDERLMFVRYEQLVEGLERDRLFHFGLTDIDEEQIWESDATDVNDYIDDAWHTPLYGQKMNSASLRRHETQADPILQEMVIRRCGDTANRLGLSLL